MPILVVVFSCLGVGIFGMCMFALVAIHEELTEIRKALTRETRVNYVMRDAP